MNIFNSDIRNFEICPCQGINILNFGDLFLGGNDIKKFFFFFFTKGLIDPLESIRIMNSSELSFL